MPWRGGRGASQNHQRIDTNRQPGPIPANVNPYAKFLKTIVDEGLLIKKATPQRNLRGCSYVPGSVGRGSKTNHNVKRYDACTSSLLPLPSPDEESLPQFKTDTATCFYCDACERSFISRLLLDEHLTTHVRCERCPFTADRAVISQHFQQHHSNVDSDDFFLTTHGHVSELDDKKWIDERKRNYPTRKRIAQKVQLMKQESEARQQRVAMLRRPEQQKSRMQVAREKEEADKRKIAIVRRRRPETQIGDREVSRCVNDLVNTVADSHSIMSSMLASLCGAKQGKSPSIKPDATIAVVSKKEAISLARQSRLGAVYRSMQTLERTLPYRLNKDRIERERNVILAVFRQIMKRNFYEDQ